MLKIVGPRLRSNGRLSGGPLVSLSPRNFFSVIASTVPVLLSTASARYLLPILRVSILESRNRPILKTGAFGIKC